MAEERIPKFEIPAEMRQMAEQSVEQARKAFDGFIAAAQQAVSTLEGQAAVAQAGARDVGKKAMTFAEQNVANSFEFAHKLVRAKDVQEILWGRREHGRQGHRQAQGFLIRGFMIRYSVLPERLLHCDRVSHRGRYADFLRDCGE